MSAVMADAEHIVFLERGSLDSSVRRPSFPPTWEEYGRVAPDEAIARLANATIAIVNKTPLTAAADTVLQESDVVTLHLPLTTQPHRGTAAGADETRGVAHQYGAPRNVVTG